MVRRRKEFPLLSARSVLLILVMTFSRKREERGANEEEEEETSITRNGPRFLSPKSACLKKSSLRGQFNSSRRWMQG